MMELIPAIDLFNHQCVRLTKGDYKQMTVYPLTPLQQALYFEQKGIRKLHLVDLEGAREGKPKHLDVLREIKLETQLEVDFSGGIRDEDSLQNVLEAGADKVCIGSLAVHDPELFYRWMDKYGPTSIILAADVKDGWVATAGWQESSNMRLEHVLADFLEQGGRRAMITDIGRDGTLSGPSVDLYRKVRADFPGLEIVASGGISKADEVYQLFQEDIQAVILGKAWYEGHFTEEDLDAYVRRYELFIRQCQIPENQGGNPVDSQPRGIGIVAPLPQSAVSSQQRTQQLNNSTTQRINTLSKRIIPCLDVKDGRTVKGVNFVGLVDAGDPVELAGKYSREGADELVFLDITASHEKRSTLIEMVRKVAEKVSIPFTVGGGIQGVEEVQLLLESGADKVSVNSAAVKDPALLSRLAARFGSQCVVLAVDARYTGERWEVYTQGGRKAEGKELFAWVREAVERGAGEILFTSMDHDGTKDGFALEALERISREVSVPLIASGGAGKKEHFRDVFTIGKADAALAASVFHYNEIPIPELKKYLSKQQINVRL